MIEIYLCHQMLLFYIMKITLDSGYQNNQLWSWYFKYSVNIISPTLPLYMKNSFIRVLGKVIGSKNIDRTETKNVRN